MPPPTSLPLAGFSQLSGVRSRAPACQESVKNLVETRVIGGLWRLGRYTGQDVNHSRGIVNESDRKVLMTCKLGKLSFVAGAELSKRYIVAC